MANGENHLYKLTTRHDTMFYEPLDLICFIKDVLLIYYELFYFIYFCLFIAFLFLLIASIVLH